MTYKDALKVKNGDTLYPKNSFAFTVKKITETSSVANTEQYINFMGINTRGIEVYYNHKEIGGFKKC